MARSADPAGVSAHRVGIVAFDGYQGLDLIGPYEVFRSASDALALTGSAHRYETLLIGPSSPIPSDTGLQIGPVVTPADAGPLDTLIVPGGRGMREAATDPALVAVVSSLAGGAARTASVCTGAFLLAATGLLDGRTVATHWAYAAELARVYPGIRVDGDSIHRHDGDLWSSAGVTAGIDLALALVEHDHGAELAHLVASWLVVFLRRPGGQRQFARAVHAPAAPHPSVAAAQRHIAEHLDGDLRVERLADVAAISPRHFARLFRAHTGLSPAAYVQQRRLDAARELLETTDEPLTRIARDCGLGSAETLRRVMADHVGVSPDAYRRRFGHHTPQPPAPTSATATA